MDTKCSFSKMRVVAV